MNADRPRDRRSLRARGPQLPCPGVELDRAWLGRIQGLALRVASMLERTEGAGRPGASGAGQEFVGYRPYRPGEDLRALDWGLLARLGKPFVRTSRRETAEVWHVYLDASRSMGCGPPGKLQAAAELCGGLAGVALHLGARVRVLASGTGGVRRFELRRRADLTGLVTFLGALRAEDDGGLAQVLGAGRPEHAAGRVILIGDLFDLEPPAVLKLMARGRGLTLLQVLCPDELSPPPESSIDWRDPEGEVRRRVQLDASSLAHYERAMEDFLGRWRGLATHATIEHQVHPTTRDFEETLARSFAP